MYIDAIRGDGMKVGYGAIVFETDALTPEDSRVLEKFREEWNRMYLESVLRDKVLHLLRSLGIAKQIHNRIRY